MNNICAPNNEAGYKYTCTLLTIFVCRRWLRAFQLWMCEASHWCNTWHGMDITYSTTYELHLLGGGRSSELVFSPMWGDTPDLYSMCSAMVCVVAMVPWFASLLWYHGLCCYCGTTVCVIAINKKQIHFQNVEHAVCSTNFPLSNFLLICFKQVSVNFSWIAM